MSHVESGPLVDFVVIGAMKAMTTSLLATLAEHPGVAVSTEKETQYFVAEVGYGRGPDWYRSLYAHAAPGQLRGEASPQYTFFPVYAGVAERIAAQAPAARIVYLVRDPVDRLLSQYRHAVDLSGEQRPLREAVLNDARYQNPSRYWLQLTQYLRCFPEDQVLVVDSDRLVTQPEAALREVVAFVGADADVAPRELARLNTSEQRVRQPPRRRRLRRRPPPRGVSTGAIEPLQPDPLLLSQLRDVLASDARDLARHLGPAAPAWARDAL